MAISISKRPRNLGIAQSAAILYGDWGTSKAYVIGLAFAIAGYASFWLILAVCILNAMVAVNYIYICKFSPSGGGVYSSAKNRSQILALIGAFFLVADYLITASLSALACFSYIGVMRPEFWAIGAIIGIGILNLFGSRHSGNAALGIAGITFIVVLMLGALSIPFVGQAVSNVQPLVGGPLANWDIFVGIIVALSGIEAIANQTGVMKLDPGSTDENPSVHQTSKWAIIIVMIEVCFFTAFFGLMMNAIPDLRLVDGNINAGNMPDIRDYMLKYMGEFFVTDLFGNAVVGEVFGFIVSTVFAILLLSAVNTAIVSLVSLFYVMSKDGQMPDFFQKMTSYGVPYYPLIFAVAAPAVVLIFVSDVAGLANLYAVGFVGAIALNLGMTASNSDIPMKKSERCFMYVTFVIMLIIEVTLFMTKPAARRFAIAILALGLVLRAWVIEMRQKVWSDKKVDLKHASLYEEDEQTPIHYGAMLCVVNTIGKTLNFAIFEAKKLNEPLYILFIKEQKVISDADRRKLWIDDEDACKLFDYAKDSSHEINIKFFYTVTDLPSTTIVQAAKDLQTSRLIIGRPRENKMLKLLRGNLTQELAEKLPKNIDLVTIS